jgi:hypothetical protein
MMPDSNASMNDDGGVDGTSTADAAGLVWRVFDAVDRASLTTRLRLGARCAACRIFVAPDGTRRVYEFAIDEQHEFDALQLAGQLARARRVRSRQRTAIRADDRVTHKLDES